jgi:DNA-binding NtrC family response regulator
VDVRIVAATHRSLTEEIVAGRFREDLFYRLAVAVLHIPPLRERREDLPLLIDRFLRQINSEAASEPGYQEKKLTAGARNLLLAHSWPGNVRELLNTLRRVALWSEGSSITVDDAREALLPGPAHRRPEVMGRPLGNGLDLPALIEDVARHYLGRAMAEAHGQKTKAAELVGLPSYQTLSNWLAKYKVGTGWQGS